MTSPKRVAALMLVPLLLALPACGQDSSTPATADPGQCSYPESADAAKQVDPPPADPPADLPEQVTLKTDRGDIPINLDVEKAPCTVNSFISLAEQQFFDNTTCHRLVVGGKRALNVLQCGDPSGTGSGGPGYQFADELIDKDPRLQPCFGQPDQSGREICTYTAGTVAMANAGPDTNGSQFFLVFQDSPLGSAYTVFGRMTAAGVQVVREIAQDGNGPDGVAPKTPVTIESVK